MYVLRLSFRLPLYYELKTLLLLGIAFILYSVSIIGTTPIVEEGCQFALLYRSALFPVRRARRSFRDQVTLPISFDCRVSNLVLYYCIVIVSPFVNQNQLSSMREYLRKASTSLDDAMASNPVPTDRPIPSAQLYATLPRGMFPVC